MNKILSTFLLATALAFVSCNEDKKDADLAQADKTSQEDFNFKADEFADLKILRYQIPGWENLSLKEQKLVYYLTQAGLAGRDIIWDQNYRHNLEIREALENIYANYKGDTSSEDWKAFEIYLKRVWFSNGIHHHYSNAKLKPGFSKEYFDTLLKETNTDLTGEAYEVIFNDKDAKKVNLNEADGLIEGSAVNMYGEGITAAEVDAFYANKKSPNPEKPLAYGINTKLVKENGKLVEKVYKSGGLYGEAIDEIVNWLEKAKGVAENEKQANALGLLIEYYNTGDLQTWDDYNDLVWIHAAGPDLSRMGDYLWRAR